MLSARILQLVEALGETERENLKLLLGMAAGQLAPVGGGPLKESRFAAYRTVAVCLAQLQPHYMRIPENGIAWRGQPSFIGSSKLTALQREASECRRTALKHDVHYLGCGGPLADSLALSDELCALVEASAGPVRATGTASYIYYDEPSHNICPHIDTDVFSINALLMLRHDSRSPPQSALELYPANGQRELIRLAPGEMIVFWADSVIHARTGVGPGEVVNILTIGFQPADLGQRAHAAS